MSNNIFFTADTHVGHSNIIKYCKRPFDTHEEMDEAMLDRFNSVLKPGDLLYHLGDVAWSSYPLDTWFTRLRTKEVHLVKGNHDPKTTTSYHGFRSVCDGLRTLSVSNVHFVLCHYPMRSWVGRGRGTMQLYGHVHNTMPGIGRQMDVGVDTNNFYPWALEDVVAKMKDVLFMPEQG